MRRVSFLVLLGVLVVSLLASNCLVSMASASDEKWFYWNVYLWFPPGAPPAPFKMESNLIWAEYSISAEDLYIYEKWSEDGMYFFCRAVRDSLDFWIDGVHYTGEYTLEMVIIWEWPYDPVPGSKSTNGRLRIYDGTGVFEGIMAHGSASVEFALDDTYGLILIQRQELMITQYQNDIVIQKV